MRYSCVERAGPTLCIRRRSLCASGFLCMHKNVRGARRMNVHARRTPEMRRAGWTNARHTRGTRTGCEYNTKSRFSNISRTSWNWHFTKSMSSGEGEREEVIGGSGSDRGSVGDDSLACMTSYLWNSVMKTRHISRTSCGCPPRCSTSY